MKNVSRIIVGNKTLVVEYGIQDNKYFSITCKCGRILKKDSDYQDSFSFNGNHYVYSFGGADHETILKYFPELKDVVNLHLSDLKGIPMHAIENGLYHLKNGFNKIKLDDENFYIEFCEYYRIDKSLISELKEVTNTTEYALFLFKNNIFSNWENEAKNVIEKYNLN